MYQYGYRVKGLADKRVLAIAAVDRAGRTRNWLRSVRTLGHWRHDVACKSVLQVSSPTE